MNKEIWVKGSDYFNYIHNLPVQVKKQKYARAKRLSDLIVEIDNENKKAIFKSSFYNKNYHTTLTTCECDIFFNNPELPCKHIYRLAYELALLDKPIIVHKGKIKDTIHFSYDDYPQIYDDFWNTDIEYFSDFHNDSEQLKRQKSALDNKMIIENLNIENQTCNISGSGKNPYFVSLEDCTCKDFTMRQLPCKHIYRLAHELNIFKLL